MSPRTPSLRRRPARIVPSVLMSLAILLPAGYLLWAIVLRFAQGSWPDPVATGAPAVLEAPLSHPGVLTAAILATVLGLVLMLCALVPGKHRTSVLQVDENLYQGSEETVITHRGVANLLQARTSRVDGVDRVGAEVTDRRIRLHVDTPLHETGEVTRRVQEVATRTVERVPFRGAPAVSVSARAERNRR